MKVWEVTLMTLLLLLPLLVISAASVEDTTTVGVMLTLALMLPLLLLVEEEDVDLVLVVLVMTVELVVIVVLAVVVMMVVVTVVLVAVAVAVVIVVEEKEMVMVVVLLLLLLLLLQLLLLHEGRLWGYWRGRRSRCLIRFCDCCAKGGRKLFFVQHPISVRVHCSKFLRSRRRIEALRHCKGGHFCGADDAVSISVKCKQGAGHFIANRRRLNPHRLLRYLCRNSKRRWCESSGGARMVGHKKVE
mmetsp:Transcript_1275/g.2352  ORF Transcript_1275/g.2352 Transcript_1275/m.2352 type:complete len:245 (-) Transcript_1275:88-822(-)